VPLLELLLGVSTLELLCAELLLGVSLLELLLGEFALLELLFSGLSTM
jgi:hypothetical protein